MLSILLVSILTTVHPVNKNILKYIKPNDYVISLAIEGKQIDSVELSKLIDKTFITNPTITFIIGESNGLSDEIKNKSAKSARSA